MELDNNISKELSRVGTTIEGPCLPWCFTHNRPSYIMIGIIIGVIGYDLFIKYKNKK
jgi:hypothetical protein